MFDRAFDLRQRERQGVQAFGLRTGTAVARQDPPYVPPRAGHDTHRESHSGLSLSAPERRGNSTELHIGLPVYFVERGGQLLKSVGAGHSTHCPVEDHDRLPMALDRVRSPA
jgi:hypothetical protein